MTRQERVSLLVKKIRTDLHLSQSDLANSLSLSVNTIRKWEAGASTPDTENLGKLSVVAGYRTADMIDYIEGRIALPDDSDIEVLLDRVRAMPDSQLFRVAGVVGMRLAEKVGVNNFAEAC